MAAHYFPVTWIDLHRDSRALAWRLAELGPFTRIVAIARGGLAPAAIIARELDIRNVDTVCIVSYEEGEGGIARGMGKAAFQSVGRHSSSPRTMVKNSTFVAAALAARVLRRVSSSMPSGASTAVRARA